jgi:hypothetical protein
MQLAIIGTALGQQIVNIHSFQASTAQETSFTSDGAAATACAALVTDWNTNQKASWLLCHPVDYALVQLRGQVIERPGNRNHRLTPTEFAASGNGTALGGVAAEDPQTAAVLKWRTPQAGKSYRGRTYVGPVIVSWVVDGRLSATAQTAYQAYSSSLMTAYGSAGGAPITWALTIYSRPYDNGEYGYVKGQGPNRQFYFPPDYNGHAVNVTNASLDPIVRVQRRRQIGVGS